MSALPYIPLFVADYLADTSHLSTLEHGAYLLLIMNYWQRGSALPCGDAQLCRIARISQKEWAAIKPAIAQFFEEVDDKWMHKRIETELQKVRNKSMTKALAGKASAEAKAQRKANTRSTPVEQMPNYTETDTETERESEGARAPDPKHWQEVQGYLSDHASDLTDWEVDFLHSVKWVEGLTAAQSTSLKSIRDKLKSTGQTVQQMFTVKSGTPEFAAWIAHRKASGQKTGFIEKRGEMTVPSLMPPKAEGQAA